MNHTATIIADEVTKAIEEEAVNAMDTIRIHNQERVGKLVDSEMFDLLREHGIINSSECSAEQVRNRLDESGHDIRIEHQPDGFMTIRLMKYVGVKRLNIRNEISIKGV